MDVAKGICIILVVMMHSTLGVEKAIGAETSLHAFIEWARPFRMPDFFLISGLFLAARIDRPWRAYLDTKVVHFAYFYVLWVNIQFAMKAPGMVQRAGSERRRGAVPAELRPAVRDAVVHLPAGRLFRRHQAAARCAKAGRPRRRRPAARPGAAYRLAGRRRVRRPLRVLLYGLRRGTAGAGAGGRIWTYPALLLVPALVAWGWLNWLAVDSGVAVAAWSDLPFAYAGVLAVIAFSVLLARSGRGGALAYCGRNSIVIYLAFAVFMGPTRVLLLKLAPLGLADATALAVTAAGVLGALCLFWLVRNTPARFLFVRPDAFKLTAPAAKRSAPSPTSRARPARVWSNA